MQRPRSFPSGEAFRTWLRKNRARKTELFVRCFRVAEKTRGMTYREALDEALCFGWIDGVRGGLDGVSFSVRFTPRQPKSKWSIVNIRRAKKLEREGRMDPSGAAAFKARIESGYSFESEERRLSQSFEKEFRAIRVHGIITRRSPHGIGGPAPFG